MDWDLIFEKLESEILWYFKTLKSTMKDAHLFQKIYIVENSILFKILTFSNSYQLKQV